MVVQKWEEPSFFFNQPSRSQTIFLLIRLDRLRCLNWQDSWPVASGQSGWQKAQLRPSIFINFSDRRERRVISTVVYHHRLASSIGLSFIPTAVFLKLAWFDRAAEVVFVRWKMILLRNTDKCSCVGYLYNLLTNNTKIVHVPHWILRHCTLCFTVRWLTGPTRSSC